MNSNEVIDRSSMLAETPLLNVLRWKEPSVNITVNGSIELEDSSSASGSQSNLRPFGVSSEELASRLYSSLREDDFEYGTSSKTELIYSEMLRENHRLAKEALEKVLLKHYGDVSVVCGLLRVISHFTYAELEPQGMIVVTACTPHVSEEVIECAIRCCENWEDKEALSVLKNIKVRSDWLNDYLKDVINNIEQGA